MHSVDLNIHVPDYDSNQNCNNINFQQSESDQIKSNFKGIETVSQSFSKPRTRGLHEENRTEPRCESACIKCEHCVTDVSFESLS